MSVNGILYLPSSFLSCKYCTIFFPELQIFPAFAVFSKKDCKTKDGVIYYKRHTNLNNDMVTVSVCFYVSVKAQALFCMLTMPCQICVTTNGVMCFSCVAPLWGRTFFILKPQHEKAEGGLRGKMMLRRIHKRKDIYI